jgi:hypothetical protein
MPTALEQENECINHSSIHMRAERSRQQNDGWCWTFIINQEKYMVSRVEGFSGTVPLIAIAIGQLNLPSRCHPSSDWHTTWPRIWRLLIAENMKHGRLCQ